MKVIDFQEIKILDVKVYKTIKIKLELDKELDLPFSKFYDSLKETIKKQLAFLEDHSENVPVVFSINTDLNNLDLSYARNNILAALTDVLIGEENKIQRHAEKRLGTMGFDHADINLFQFMELINYKTKANQFDVLFYDSSNRLYRPLILRKV